MVARYATRGRRLSLRHWERSTAARLIIVLLLSRKGCEKEIRSSNCWAWTASSTSVAAISNHNSACLRAVICLSWHWQMRFSHRAEAKSAYAFARSWLVLARGSNSERKSNPRLFRSASRLCTQRCWIHRHHKRQGTHIAIVRDITRAESFGSCGPAIVPPVDCLEVWMV